MFEEAVWELCVEIVTKTTSLRCDAYLSEKSTSIQTIQWKVAEWSNIANILVNAARKSIVHAQSFVEIHNSYAPSLRDNLNKNPMNRLIERQNKKIRIEILATVWKSTTVCSESTLQLSRLLYVPNQMQETQLTAFPYALPSPSKMSRYLSYLLGSLRWSQITSSIAYSPRYCIRQRSQRPC